MDVGEMSKPSATSTSPCGQALVMSRTEKGDMVYGRHCICMPCCLSSSGVKRTNSFSSRSSCQKERGDMTSK